MEILKGVHLHQPWTNNRENNQFPLSAVLKGVHFSVGPFPSYNPHIVHQGIFELGFELVLTQEFYRTIPTIHGQQHNLPDCVAHLGGILGADGDIVRHSGVVDSETDIAVSPPRRGKIV